MSQQKSSTIPAHIRQASFCFDNPAIVNSTKLEQGKIKLTVENSNLLFRATSGLPGFQSLASSYQKGKGRIPSCEQVNILSYFLKTTPVYLPNVKGVNGNFYPILPFAVKTCGYMRSDMGIHADKNVPGSSGCIVITSENHWEVFQQKMLNLSAQGILQIPLIVY